MKRCEAMTFGEIAKVLGTTEQNVCQIHGRAMRKIVVDEDRVVEVFGVQIDGAVDVKSLRRAVEDFVIELRRK